MSWHSRRHFLPATSSHHQTVLGKALYEHGNCQRVAAVALSSSSIQNSSLGPNLLALTGLDQDTLTLFASVFLSCENENNATLQFTNKLSIYYDEQARKVTSDSIIHRFGSFVASLINNTKYFQKSLQEMNAEFKSPLFWSSLLPSSPIFTSLKKLKIHCCSADGLLQNIARLFPMLEELTLQTFSDDEISAESFHGLTNLTSLDLSSSYNITDDCAETIAVSCVNLTYLNLSGCKQITDGALQAISTKLVNLTSLNLAYCGQIADAGLEAIAAKCGNLTSLDLHQCVKITDIGLQSIAGLHNLTSLNLSFCEKITDASLQAITVTCVSLTSLRLFSCKNITDASLQCIASSLADLNLLKLHRCYKITDVGVQAVAASCNDLTSLDLSYCDNITDAGLQSIAASCVNLTSLELAFCDKITDVGLEALTAKLVQLSLLNLCFCAKITKAGKANAKKARPTLIIG